MTAGATLWQTMINHYHIPQILSQTEAVACQWIRMVMGGLVGSTQVLFLCLYVVAGQVWSSVLGRGPYILWSALLLNNLIISQWLPCIIYTAKGDNANARMYQRLLVPLCLLCPCTCCLCVFNFWLYGHCRFWKSWPVQVMTSFFTRPLFPQDLLLTQITQILRRVLLGFVSKSIQKGTLMGSLSSAWFLVYEVFLYPFLGQFNKLPVCRPLCFSCTCILAGGNS